MLELAQARERRGVEVPVGHGDVLEQAAQLLSASPSVPLATEAGQDPLDLVEGHAVAAIVAARLAEAGHDSQRVNRGGELDQDHLAEGGRVSSAK